MPMRAACIEQAFAQETGELFVEETRAMRVVPGSGGQGDRPAAVEDAAEPAGRHRSEPRPVAAVFATGQAA
jgi:hypothetical protein